MAEPSVCLWSVSGFHLRLWFSKAFIIPREQWLRKSIANISVCSMLDVEESWMIFSGVPDWVIQKRLKDPVLSGLICYVFSHRKGSWDCSGTLFESCSYIFHSKMIPRESYTEMRKSLEEQSGLPFLYENTVCIILFRSAKLSITANRLLHVCMFRFITKKIIRLRKYVVVKAVLVLASLLW